MPAQRKQFSAEFKTKVALEAIRANKTLAEMASQFGVHANQISQWKAQAMDALPEVFSRRRRRQAQEERERTEQLYQQIGRLKVELDWVKKKSGLEP